jgi:3-hydroxypropanoate dehydrogenase
MTTSFPTDARAIDDRTADVLFREAHTAYSFNDEPVSDAVLAEIYDLVRYAPTLMNAQPLRIVYLRTDEAKARLLPHLAQGNRAKAESAPVVAILAADMDFHEHFPRTFPQVPGAKDSFGDPAARARTAISNAAIQTGYFILAVRAAGLDAGPLGGFDRDGVDAEFFAGTTLRSQLVVNLGHAAAGGTNPRNPRLELDEAVTML